MKKRLFLFYSFIILMPFLLGILLEYKRPIIYQNFLDIIKKNIRLFEIRNNYPENLCNISSLSTLPYESNLIIGHLYGHPSVSEENPLGKIKDFISENRENLKSVIFTGDIFKNPSYKKWLELKSFLNKLDINFYIAPGNHDVGIENGAARDLFKLVFDFRYPQVVKFENEIFIFEDTTINKWNFNEETLQLIEENSSEEISLYVFTHNIIFDELSTFANSRVGKPKKLLKAQYIYSKIQNKYKSVSIISGDTGAFDFMPSMACYRLNNLFAIANGFGNRVENEVLVIKDNQIFSYVL